MVDLQTYSSLSDREVVQRIKEGKDTENQKYLKQVLYTRYEKFVHKHWHKLYKQLNASMYLSQLKDEFYSDSYLTFSNALDAVKTEKILNDKWRFLGYYGFYLSNQRKNYAKKVLRKYKSEVSLEVPDENGENTVYLSDLTEDGKAPSAEDTVIEQDFKERFWKALQECKEKDWDKTCNTLFDLKSQGLAVKKICEKLDISSWKYSKLLEGMRQQLSNRLGG